MTQIFTDFCAEPDMSTRMLVLLRQKYAVYAAQLHLLQGRNLERKTLTFVKTRKLWAFAEQGVPKTTEHRRDIDIMKQQKQSFSAQIRKNVSLNYLLCLPKGYHDTSETTWPLILFLHGMGERGEDLELIKKHGVPKVVEEKDDFPFVVISPQCPQHSVWPEQIDTLHALLEEVIQKYHIDTSRIYLTGLSMGGFGSWHLAEADPHLFAAVVPICGGTLPHVGFPERIKVLKEIPIWVFHGAKDEIVALQMSQELVDVLKAHNGNVKFTVYPEAGHDSWTATYNNPELYDWLLEQKNDHFQL